MITENMKIYEDWFAVWVLLGCYKREFFRTEEDITAEKLEALREKSLDMIEFLTYSKEIGVLRLDDIDDRGGYEAILRGLHVIKERATQNAETMTITEWRELEYITIKIRSHAWAQWERANCRVREERRAEAIP